MNAYIDYRKSYRVLLNLKMKFKIEFSSLTIEQIPHARLQGYVF